MEFLSATFPGRWIGRGGSILWPPRSPDLTQLGFLFWGPYKELRLHGQIRDLNSFKARTRDML
jgi:hypothetical protein